MDWCSHRFCTDHRAVPLITYSGATLTPPPPPTTLGPVYEVADGPCADYVTLDDPDRSVNYTGNRLKCDQRDLEQGTPDSLPVYVM